MVVVDSSVWIDFLNGVTNPETQWLDLNLDRERIGLTTLILTEVLQGLRTDPERLTLGLQLIGRPFDEETLFTLAGALEEAAPKIDYPQAWWRGA